MRAVPTSVTKLAAVLATCLLSSVALGQTVPGGTRPPVGGAAGGAAAPAAAAAPSAGTNVAVIDIAHIFKNHNKFKQQMDGLKGQIEAFEGSMKKEQAKLEKMKEEGAAYKPSSPEYKKKEEEFARMMSELNVQVALKRKEFSEQEAKIYYNTYNEIVAATANFAERNRIGLVLRFSGDEMDPQDRGSVLQGVNRPVVLQRQLDITEFVLGICNPPGVRTATGPGPGTGPGKAPTSPGGTKPR